MIDNYEWDDIDDLALEKFKKMDMQDRTAIIVLIDRFYEKYLSQNQN